MVSGKYILGNWKMHGSQAEARALLSAIASQKTTAHVAVFPPAPLLPVIAWALKDSHIKVGAQDCSIHKEGAYTGDVSAGIVKDAGCGYVIVGHSERRALHNETDEIVGKKAQAAIAAGLIPVICVGETLEQRESGNYLKVIESQLAKSIPATISSPFIVAYEPVWAIGSGKTPTIAQIEEVHKTIACALSYATSGTLLGIVYGGSVKAANAVEILKAQGVDGVLVGGASLKSEEFSAIIAAAG